ncbi:MAG: hypothetical protein EO766_16635 [Hydrotalea sp. AMD]|uniref:hypothetical protein n=1 Tax=Hydrotalea sp. AMD TaxID=2501297 RepID=UPI001025C7E7|nr:hypothetical protein [Hydrotalea sp. AMD]RWZ85538.1 MAG: hypothetical protein EO766_16635 [Hydrotalea sp. AMD]
MAFDRKALKKYLKENPDDRAALLEELGVSETGDPDLLDAITSLTSRVDALEKIKPSGSGNDPEPKPKTPAGFFESVFGLPKK